MRVKEVEMSRISGSPARKATNLSLDADLLDEARALDINISRACERGLVDRIAEVRAERWRAENAEALASSNEYVERHGLPLAGYRHF
jgi:antitoxin CcdA